MTQMLVNMNSVHYAFIALMVALLPISLISYQTSAIPDNIPVWYQGVIMALMGYAIGRQGIKSGASLKGMVA